MTYRGGMGWDGVVGRLQTERNIHIYIQLIQTVVEQKLTQ